MKTITILVVIASYISAGPTNPSGRISYGEVAERGQFPYQVSVQLSLGFTFYPSCGGSILSPEYILTAAHCFPIPGAASYQVLAGITNVYDVNVGEQRRNVLNYVIHELYQSGFVLASPHDIAVVQLTDPLIYTDTIKPIALPPVNAEFTGIATLSGWGETETGRESSILLYAEIPLIDVTDQHLHLFDNISIIMYWGFWWTVSLKWNPHRYRLLGHGELRGQDLLAVCLR
ncbi:coagulation factor IX-like isoform X2 [Cylas formicarius]|uniref:coagulation factor IX-like isoform X2 n=1 Tax=Cylas formicarius TaxID=197179 RepID=UPI0029587B6B|nr:coagulation factor IX-like isoform X2 [Cylas formicarius]